MKRLIYLLIPFVLLLSGCSDKGYNQPDELVVGKSYLYYNDYYSYNRFDGDDPFLKPTDTITILNKKNGYVQYKRHHPYGWNRPCFPDGFDESWIMSVKEEFLIKVVREIVPEK